MLYTWLFIIVWNLNIVVQWFHENGDKRIVGSTLYTIHLLVIWTLWELEVKSMRHIHIQQDKDGEIR